jgi:predicted amidohydrolase YtcJ
MLLGKLFCLIALLGVAAPALAQPADTILTGGRIVTLDERSTVAEAMAIRGDRIIAVGRAPDIRKLAGAKTRVIDLAGRTVIPGLIDSHIHAIRAGLRFGSEVSWIGSPSIADAMARLRDAARKTPPGGWIVVTGGWTPQQFTERRLPTRAELMEAAPGHAVYIQLFYGAVLLTPRAFEKLGIKSDADVPPRGKIQRRPDGSPTGWIHGKAATITGLYNRLPPPTLAQSIAGTRSFFRELNRFGLTGVIDPGGYNLAPEQYEALFRLWRRRGLTVRVAYSICAPSPGGELADFRRLTRFLPMGTGDDWLRFNGIGERVTWGMNNNPAPTDAQKDAFYRIGLWAAERGMTLTMHWPRDSSVHHLLELFERIGRAVPLRHLRWSVAHVHDASIESLRRMKALGLGWLVQNRLYFAGTPSLLARGDKLAHTPPLKSAIGMGLRIGGGTDAHRVMDYNPFLSLRWMIDGLTVEGVETRGAAELPSREQALRIYTAGSAWFAHDEQRRGALTVGRLADLAVLDRDYLTVPVRRIGHIRSLLTMVGGRIVYAAGPYQAFEARAAQ